MLTDEDKHDTHTGTRACLQKARRANLFTSLTCRRVPLPSHLPSALPLIPPPHQWFPTVFSGDLNHAHDRDHGLFYKE